MDTLSTRPETGNRKPETGNRKPETGNRKPETGNRKPETGNRQTFGLSPQWVLYDGRPFASALGLSHVDQLNALAASAPEALPVARVVGDPCYDRILASLTQRERYRRALGTGDRTLVVVSSTWGPGSLLGSWPDLVRRLLAELPIDSHQVALALHPNTWHGHGPWQIRCWLADCRRSGLTLLPEIDGWRSGLIAADLLIGDHGSVTGYGAAIGVPTALAAFPDDDVAPDTPISALGSTAPRLNPAKPLLDQLDEAIALPAQADAVAERVTSAPGDALNRLRSVCYDVLGLPEPAGEPPLLPLPVAAVPAEDRPPASVAFRAAHTTDARTKVVHLSRRPAELATAPDRHDDLHVSCPHDYPLRTIRASAAVLTCQRAELPADAATWIRDTFERHPACRTVAVLDEHSCLVRTRTGAQLLARTAKLPPDVLASAVHAWAAEPGTVPQEISIDLDGTRHRATITPS
ncbi:hypothetical protein OU416_25975 [Saccharopolyspora indica]|uniref:hypothetical protein n=1 Tax=Saccharopolyspora indica TaxID=1229659 RepID=UPI0022EB7CEF|nr:hypothetical protein [Saccharopolyspora indica]MDA3647533.1 hypothetical protein [Saccharopolyspora indica]